MDVFCPYGIGECEEKEQHKTLATKTEMKKAPLSNGSQ